MKRISIIITICSLSCPSLFSQEMLSLEQCRAMALKYNKEMAASIRQTESALYTVKSYKGNFFPNFTANGTGIYSNADGGYSSGSGNLPVFLPDATGQFLPNGGFAYFPGIDLNYKIGAIYMGGIQMEQPLYMGGKISAAYKMSVLGKEMAQMNETLTNSEEVDALVSTIEVNNLETIVSFGAEAAEEIAKASDVVLNSMSMSQLDESSEMLESLSKIMSKFDPSELQENKGLFNKLFGNMKKQLEKILDKYHTMGEEVDKIYVQLREYEGEIKQSNRKLEQMFDANVDYYHQLVKYILAGEQGCRELEAYIAQRQADFEATGDNSIQLELAGLNNALMMLEQRTQDLRVAENIAIQSIPMIKTMAYSNMNLVRKINSAFIVTLPVFKQGLAQAVMLKRQKIQAEALSELDKKTNEMLIKNARNTVEQSKMTARLASGSSVKIETLETTWRTIVNGIEETQNIQKEARKQRIDDAARLENIKQEFLKTYGGAGK